VLCRGMAVLSCVQPSLCLLHSLPSSASPCPPRPPAHLSFLPTHPYRPTTKLYHFTLHTAALVCTTLGVVAAFKSHTAKRPAPMPNL